MLPPPPPLPLLLFERRRCSSCCCSRALHLRHQRFGWQTAAKTPATARKRIAAAMGDSCTQCASLLCLLLLLSPPWRFGGESPPQPAAAQPHEYGRPVSLHTHDRTAPCSHIDMNDASPCQQTHNKCHHHHTHISDGVWGEVGRRGEVCVPAARALRSAQVG